MSQRNPKRAGLANLEVVMTTAIVLPRSALPGLSSAAGPGDAVFCEGPDDLDPVTDGLTAGAGGGSRTLVAVATRSGVGPPADSGAWSRPAGPGSGRVT